MLTPSDAAAMTATAARIKKVVLRIGKDVIAWPTSRVHQTRIHAEA
jgi:hypothetical protein